MSPRVLREITVDPDMALPDNVVQVISVSSRYKVGIKNNRPLYRWRIVAVVEEEASQE